MATKLNIYNGALALLGETPLASLSEARSARYWLDRSWDNGIVNSCLQESQWNWATRTQRITASTTIIPAFGPTYAFEVPSDFMGINSIWIDEYCLTALQQYNIEAGVIYCEFNTIYLKFISNSATYGNNLARWPETFSRFVEASLAKEVQPNITNSLNVGEKISSVERNALLKSKNYDMRNKPRQRINAGSWVNSRVGGYRNNSNYNCSNNG